MRKLTLILSLITAIFLTACGGGGSDIVTPQKISVSLKKEAVTQYVGYGQVYWQRLYMPLAEIIVSPATTTCKSLDIIIEGLHATAPNIFVTISGKDITGTQTTIMNGIRVGFSSSIDIGNGASISIFTNIPNSVANERYLFKAKSLDCGAIAIEGLPLSLGLVNTTSYDGPPPTKG